MCEFRSLSPQTFEENSPENLSVFSQCLEHYFYNTKEENLPHFLDQNEIPYQNNNSSHSMRNIAVQCAEQFPVIYVPFTCKILQCVNPPFKAKNI